MRNISKLGYLTTIHQPDPSKFNPIKGINKNFHSYRLRIMELVIPKEKFEDIRKEYFKQKDINIRELKYLKKRMKFIEQNILKNKRKEKDLKYVLKIIKK